MTKFSIANFYLFMLNPLLGTVVSLTRLVSHEKQSIIYISLFMGVCAYNLVPYATMDLATHYNQFVALKDITYSEVINSGVNVLLYIEMKLIDAIGLNKEWLPFLFTSVSYYLILISLSCIIKGFPYRDKILIFTLSLLTISFFATANGLRNGLSTALFVYALCCYLNGKKIKSALISILSVLTHSFTLPLVLFLIISNILLKLPLRFLKFVMLFSLVVSVSVSLTPILLFLLEKMSFISYVDMINRIYILGDRWGANASFDETSSIIRFITSLPLYASVLILFLSKKKNIFYVIAAATVSISLLLLDFWVISERYQYVAVLLSFFYFCSIYNNELKLKILYILLFMCQLLVLIWSIYRFRLMIIPSVEFIYMPFILCFYHTVDFRHFIRI